MINLRPFRLVVGVVSFCCTGFGTGGFHPVRADDDPTGATARTRVVPLVFSSDNTEVAFGLGGVSIGAGQAQAALFGLGFKSENDSSGISVGALNYQIPDLPRWYFSGFFYQSDMPNYRYFVSDSPGFATRSNDSTPQFNTLGLNDLVARIQARWILPIGAGKNEGFRLSKRVILP
ncbi:MAG TPA: hypothetical protein QGF27_00200, partial [Arenicellales bacterium]|nr:hypothetical protein [Arenicellales bacterium]